MLQDNLCSRQFKLDVLTEGLLCYRTNIGTIYIWRLLFLYIKRVKQHQHSEMRYSIKALVHPLRLTIKFQNSSIT